MITHYKSYTLLEFNTYLQNLWRALRLLSSVVLKTKDDQDLQMHQNLVWLLPSSGQILALAEPEARLYNHRPDPPDHRSKCLYWLYFSHFSTEWAEILNDCYLGGKDEVCRQNIDPAALQYSMQRCRISNRTITQTFLIGLSWNLAWLLLRCK